jgi:ParB-like chromosome segregation protein Spo0J
MSTTTRISINGKYANLVPGLSIQEFDLLKRSIEEKGQWSPIYVNKDGIILDGHHRFKACQELGIAPITSVKEFEDEIEEKLFVIEHNLKRRHLTDSQKIEVAETLCLWISYMNK